MHGVAHPESCIQIPQGLPPADLVDSADHRGLKIVCGNTDYLGAAVGTNDEQMVEWTRSKLSTIKPVERAVSDPSFPVLLAFRLAKTNVLTVPTYLNRALPLRVSCVPLADFDSRVRNCLLSRLDLPVPLPAPAFTSLTQPGRNGGLGLRLRSSV